MCTGKQPANLHVVAHPVPGCSGSLLSLLCECEFLRLTSRLAPLLASRIAMFASLQDTATMSAVEPVLSWLSTRACPSSSSTSAASNLPVLAARWRGVLPVLSFTFTLAPARSSSRKMVTNPLLACRHKQNPTQKMSAARLATF